MVFPGVFQLNSGETQKDASGQVDKKGLLYNLNVLNISSDTLVIIIIGIALNLYYIYRSKIDICDILNNTEYGKNLPDVSGIPELGNFIFLYVTSVFVVINYDEYMRKINVAPDKRDNVAIVKAYNAFVASLLALIASVVSRRNYDIDNALDLQESDTQINPGLVST